MMITKSTIEIKGSFAVITNKEDRIREIIHCPVIESIVVLSEPAMVHVTVHMNSGNKSSFFTSQEMADILIDTWTGHNQFFT